MHRRRIVIVLVLTSIALLAVPAVPAVAALRAAPFATACVNPTKTITTASSTPLTLVSTDVVLVTSTGSFTGGINAFPSGAVVCVDSGGSLSPQYMNNAAGELANRGTVTFGNVAVAAGFTLANEGSASFPSGVNVNGAAIFSNLVGGTLSIGGSFSPGTGAQISNDGTMTLTGGMNLNSGTLLQNTGTVSVAGALTVDGVLRNAGDLTTSSSATVNGAGSVSNTCFWRASSGLMTNSPSFTNAGYIHVLAGGFVNQGRYSQTSTGLLDGVDFTNNQNVSGLGRYLFSGHTVTQATFAGDSATTPILFSDTSPTGPIFDQASGVVTNVVRGTVSPPIAAVSSPGCSLPTPPVADVVTSKTGPASVTGGDTVSYRVLVTNQGPDSAADVVATDTLPAELGSPVASDGGSVAAGTASWSVGTLAAGDSRTFTVSGTAPASGTLVDTVASTASTSDPDPTNNDGSSGAARVVTIVKDAIPTNRPPVVDDVAIVTTAGAPVSDAVTATDPDPGQTVTFAATSTPAHGSVILTPGGSFTYTPTDDFVGVDSFTVRGCDNGTPVLCDDATVTISVYPIAQDDAASTIVGRPVDIDVTVNDIGAVGAPTLISQPSSGTATVLSDGTVHYVPNGSFIGVVTFRYRVCGLDAPPLCDIATVTVTVEPIPNQPPSVGDQQRDTQANVPVNGVVVASDPDVGQTLTFSRSSGPSHGTAVVDPSGTYVYTPTTDFTGRDSFTVSVCDDGTPVLCSTGTVFIVVAPDAVPDAAVTELNTPVVIDVTANDIGDVATPTVADQPGNGTATVGPGSSITYTPQNGFTGTDTFSYQVCSPNDATVCATATVTVVVGAAPNHPPVVDDVTRQTVTGIPTAGRISAADPDAGQTVSATLLTQAGHGTAVVAASGTFVYVPAAGFAGIDTFVVRFCDDAPTPLCADGTVTIEVRPIARNDAAATTATAAVLIPVLANDSGTIGAPVILTGALHGTATVQSDGSVSYAPTGEFTGADLFTYRVCAIGAPSLCDTATVRVDVSPVAVDDLATTSAGKAVSVDVAANDVGDGADPVVVDGPQHGTAVFTGSVLRYRPTGTFTGVDTLTYRRCSTGVVALCSTASVTVTVYPLVHDDLAKTRQDTAVVIDVAANDFGDAGPPTVVVSAHHGHVTTTSTGELRYVPDPGFTGVDTFVYQRCSTRDSGLCAQASVVVTVTPVVTPPDGGGGSNGGGGGSGNGSGDGSGSGAGGTLPETGFRFLFLAWIASALVVSGAVILGAERAVSAGDGNGFRRRRASSPRKELVSS